MDRRTFLALTTVGLAGCASGGDQGTTTTTTTTPTTATTESTTQTTTTTTAEPAEFELVSVQAPSEAEIGEQVSYQFTVKNTGGQVGTFETTISTRTGNSNWQTSNPWRETIHPGSTATLQSQSFTSSYLASYEIKIDEFQRTFSINFVGATQAFGAPFTFRDRFELNVRGVAFEDSYQWSSNGYQYTETPTQGHKFAEVQVWAKNVGNSADYLPVKRNLSVLSGNSQYEYISDYRSSGVYRGGEVQPDIVRQGRVLYEVPDSVARPDVRVVWSNNNFSGDVSVYWSQNPEE